MWTNSFPQVILADNLRKINFDIKYFFYKDILKDHSVNCTIEKPKKLNICKKCSRDQKRIIDNFNFDYSYLEKYIVLDDILKINKILNPIKKKIIDDFVNLKYEGIPVGEFALYSSILTNKRLKISEFTKEQKKDYLRDLKECLLTICAFKKIFLSEKASSILLYNSYYGKNRCIKFLAKKYQVKAIIIHAGNNNANYLKTLVISRNDLMDHLININTRFWKKFKDIPTNIKSFNLTRQHLSSQFKSSSIFTYSKARKKNFDIRKQFKIKENQKIVLLALSSPDETNASISVKTPYPKLYDFKDQKSLIKYLADYAKQNPNIFLIIRVHPREYKNKRDSIISSNYYLIKNLSLEYIKYKNIRFNMPEDGISLYNILPYIDVFVSHGTSVNVEASLLGLPCILPSGYYPDFPNDIVKIAKNRKNFIDLINEATNKEIDISIIKKAYRFFSLYHYYATFKINFLFAPIKHNFILRIIRYIFRDIFKSLDIIFYKFFDNKDYKNDLKKNLDIKNFRYLVYPKKNQNNTHLEKELILKNYRKVLIDAKFDMNLKSKIANFNNKIGTIKDIH